MILQAFETLPSSSACKANQIVEILAKAQSILEPEERSILNEVKQEGKSLPSDSLTGKLASHIASLSSKSPASKQLYLGCWLPVVLTKGAYAGSTLLFVAFWNKAHSVGNYDTDKGDAKPASFMNLYTGILGPNAIDTYPLMQFRIC
ncbi:hypothetical protein MSP8886_03743 [Marinomonas spartinae]|uniref:Uncharacterized protein n=1 Tax=Marinomonas spartinae TaxID=1792290 RepID=A0A1A8TR66_9GAMM|nr:hypothetical protein [Marinomonas spartinae]SBS36533.1 hypothetical protein MSP8886_03743 [Marinomonas spartinae]